MGLDLTVLGCATPYSSTDNPCSGYLVSTGDTRLSEVHHTSEDAGETAGAAGAGRSIVTHACRFVTPQDAVSRASSRYDGPVYFASPTPARVGLAC